MNQSNAFIFVSLIGAAFFIAFHLYRTRSLPLLAELFELMLSVAAAQAGIALCVEIVDGAKSLGDYEGQRLIIILGGVAVFWVALITAIKLVKRVNHRAEFPATVQSETSAS